MAFNFLPSNVSVAVASLAKLFALANNLAPSIFSGESVGKLLPAELSLESTALITE